MHNHEREEHDSLISLSCEARLIIEMPFCDCQENRKILTEEGDLFVFFGLFAGEIAGAITHVQAA